MEAVTVKSLEDMQQLVVTSGHAFVADESQDGSDDLGPGPVRAASGGPWYLNGHDHPPGCSEEKVAPEVGICGMQP